MPKFYRSEEKRERELRSIKHGMNTWTGVKKPKRRNKSIELSTSFSIPEKKFDIFVALA